MLHSSSADPFKLALYKLMGRIDPSRRSVGQATNTMEDWLWFQLAMVSIHLIQTHLFTLLSVSVRWMRMNSAASEAWRKSCLVTASDTSRVLLARRVEGAGFGLACYSCAASSNG